MNASTSYPASAELLKIIPTLECSKGCYYCYNVRLRQINPLAQNKLFASVDAFLKSTESPIDIDIIGGEPLEAKARQVTLELLRLVRSYSRTRHVSVSTAVSSPKVLREIAPVVDRLYLSIDVFSGDLNKKRISERRLTEVVSALRASGVILNVSVVINGTESEADVVSFIQSLIAHDVREAGFAYEDFAEIDQERVVNTCKIFYRLFVERILRRRQIRIGGMVLDRLLDRVRGVKSDHACACGDRCIGIYPDGSISASLCYPHNDRERISTEAFAHQRTNRLSRLEVGECAGCQLWNSCKGGCIGAAAVANKEEPGRDMRQCIILRNVWPLIAKDLAASF